jgi:hypothetical protein
MEDLWPRAAGRRVDPAQSPINCTDGQAALCLNRVGPRAFERLADALRESPLLGDKSMLSTLGAEYCQIVV